MYGLVVDKMVTLVRLFNNIGKIVTVNYKSRAGETTPGSTHISSPASPLPFENNSAKFSENI
jgi:hypothetical protein